MKKGTKKSRITRAISFLTLGFFLANQVTFANPGAGIEMALKGELPAYLSMDIPAELGTVDTLYEAPSSTSPQFVLHVQNAHANYEAQMKIKQLLGYMDKKYGFKTIFVEGASEKLNADFLRFFPDEERNLKLCDELAKQGELTGAEYYLMEAGKKAEALGIEKASLYKSNYEALKKVFGAAAEVERFFKGFDARLDRAASKTLTPETRGLIADWKRFEQGRRAFMPFVKGLVKQAQKTLEIDLESLFAQVSWPQITRLLVIQRMEKELDRGKGVEEQAALIKMLRGKDVSRELLTALENFGEGSISVGKSRHEVLPRELLERLAAEAGPKGFRFSDYPHFSLYAGHVILRSELDPKTLFEEIEHLFTLMLNASAKEPRQQTLLALYGDGELVRKLLHLELNRAQWRQVIEAKDRIAIPSLVARLKECMQTSSTLNAQRATERTGSLNVARSTLRAPVGPTGDVMPEVFSHRMDEIFNAALEFYDFARRRENVFYQEIQAVMNERKLTKAVLITGGFHTDGMSDLFRDNAVSYGIVTPRLSEKSDEGLYRTSMLQSREYLFSISYIEMVSNFISAAAQLDQGLALNKKWTELFAEFMKVGKFATLDTAHDFFLNSTAHQMLRQSGYDIVKEGDRYALVRLSEAQKTEAVRGARQKIASMPANVSPRIPSLGPPARSEVRKSSEGQRGGLSKLSIFDTLKSLRFRTNPTVVSLLSRFFLAAALNGAIIFLVMVQEPKPADILDFLYMSPLGISHQILNVYLSVLASLLYWEIDRAREHRPWQSKSRSEVREAKGQQVNPKRRELLLSVLSSLGLGFIPAALVGCGSGMVETSGPARLATASNPDFSYADFPNAYDVYGPNGLVVSLPKQGSSHQGQAYVDTRLMTVPDVSPDGQRIITSQLERVTHVGSTAAALIPPTFTLSVQVYNVTKQQYEPSIRLRLSATVPIPQDQMPSEIRFLPGSLNIIQVTYANGTVEHYDATAGAKLTPAASNPDFYYMDLPNSYDVYHNAALVVSLPKQASSQQGPSYASTYGSTQLMTVPDVSENGEFVITSQLDHVTHSGSTAATLIPSTFTLSVQVYNVTKQQYERSIRLRLSANAPIPQDQMPSGIRFLPGSSNIIQATYVNGTLENYDVTTGAKLTPEEVSSLLGPQAISGVTPATRSEVRQELKLRIADVLKNLRFRADSPVVQSLARLFLVVALNGAVAFLMIAQEPRPADILDLLYMSPLGIVYQILNVYLYVSVALLAWEVNRASKRRSLQGYPVASAGARESKSRSEARALLKDIGLWEPLLSALRRDAVTTVSDLSGLIVERPEEFVRMIPDEKIREAIFEAVFPTFEDVASSKWTLGERKITAQVIANLAPLSASSPAHALAFLIEKDPANFARLVPNLAVRKQIFELLFSDRPDQIHVDSIQGRIWSLEDMGIPAQLVAAFQKKGVTKAFELADMIIQRPEEFEEIASDKETREAIFSATFKLVGWIWNSSNRSLEYVGIPSKIIPRLKERGFSSSEPLISFIEHDPVDLAALVPELDLRQEIFSRLFSVAPSELSTGRSEARIPQSTVAEISKDQSPVDNRLGLIVNAVAVARELKAEIPAVKKARLGFRPESLKRLEKALEGTGADAKLLATVLVAAVAGGIAAPEITAAQMTAVLQAIAQAQVTPLPVLVQKVRGILSVKDEEGLLVQDMDPGTAIQEADLVALANAKQHVAIIWKTDASTRAALEAKARAKEAELLGTRSGKELAIQGRFNIIVVDRANPMAGLNKFIEHKKAEMPAISRGLQRYVLMGDLSFLNQINRGDTVQGLMIHQVVDGDLRERMAASILAAKVSQEILKVTEATEIDDAVARMLDKKGTKGIYSFKADVLNAVLAVALQALQAIRSAA